MNFNFMRLPLFNVVDPGAAGGGGAPAVPPVTPPAAAAPAPTDWMGGLNDELKGFAQLKGFKDPGAVLDSYRNLEKLRGVPQERLLTLPEKADDAEGMKEIYKRLGMPEKAADYKFELKDGAGDEKFVEGLRNKFHESGISTSQAEKIMGWYNEHFETEVKAAQENITAMLGTQKEALTKEWGAAHDQNVSIAKRAVEGLKVPAEAVDALEAVMGYDGVHKFFHAIGSKMMEDNFVRSEGGPGFQNGILPPLAAQEAIKQKMSDSGFFQRLSAGEPAAKAEWEKLNKWAVGER